jgi:hypothetical protein
MGAAMTPPNPLTPQVERDKWWLSQRDELAKILEPHFKVKAGWLFALRVAEKILVAGFEKGVANSKSLAPLATALLKELDGLRAKAGWLPISEAPKTGDDLIEKCVLGYCAGEEHPNDRMKVVWWEPNIKGGVWLSDPDMACEPTHFQPLPAPPSAAQAAAEVSNG